MTLRNCQLNPRGPLGTFVRLCHRHNPLRDRRPRPHLAPVGRVPAGTGNLLARKPGPST